MYFLHVSQITKFVRPSDIPKHFIKNKLTQNGIVARVEPSMTSGPLLMINHKPLVNIYFNSKKVLPTKISGIEINSNGYSWLQAIVTSNKVEFIPLSKEGQAAECQVFLIDKDPNKKPIDIAKALLSLGFARLEPFPRVIDWDKDFVNYYEALKTVQRKAKNRRAGMWFQTLPEKGLARRLMDNAWGYAISSIIPPAKRLPELVR